jgi:hypothetical protein
MNALVDKIIEIMQSPAKVAIEAARLFPDTLVIASGIFALFTLSIPFAVMFISLLEATALFHVFRIVGSYLGAKAGYDPRASNRACRTGFSTTTLHDLSLFSSKAPSNFPSAPLYIISVASAYIFSSLNAQSEQLQALGPAYSSRYYMSLSLLCALILIFALFRLYHSCDDFGIILGTIPIGLVVGAMLLIQNYRLFGSESVNLLGIPSLAGVTATGRSLYVCPTAS